MKNIWLLTIFVLASCQTLFSTKKITKQGVTVPYLKNSPNECYYLDEFMPTPNSIVTGRTGSINLRYYTYKTATYKDWPDSDVILSFYSKDNLCWSLFEEYFVLD